MGCTCATPPAGGEGVQPEHHKGDQLDDHAAREAGAGDAGANRPDPLLDHPYDPLDVSDMFVVARGVKVKAPDGVFQSRKLSVGKACVDVVTETFIEVNNLGNRRRQGGCVLVRQRLRRHKPQAAAPRDQKSKPVYKEQVRTDVHVLVPFPY